MHRIARADLEALVYVAIACASPAIKRGMKSKLPNEAQQARSALARSICDKIDNDSYMVIVTELIGDAEQRRRGAWGLDEPVPATVPQAPPPSGGDWRL